MIVIGDGYMSVSSGIVDVEMEFVFSSLKGVGRRWMGSRIERGIWSCGEKNSFFLGVEAFYGRGSK